MDDEVDVFVGNNEVHIGVSVGVYAETTRFVHLDYDKARELAHQIILAAEKLKEAA